MLKNVIDDNGYNARRKSKEFLNFSINQSKNISIAPYVANESEAHDGED